MTHVVDLSAFMEELTADVDDVAALQEKVQAILDATEGLDFIEPGTMCICTGCDRDLRAHLQDILDHDDFALHLINPMASLLESSGFIQALLGPEESMERNVGFIMIVED